ncbi:MAG: T9SS type A sorting domain-containing protein [Ignavibacteriaceae bacterium]|jgi:parallel beta-helix repeat protein|nr:T9SS type A sorting domain-containing protein [Ignavibacteriaceae bacterium]HPO56683.1 T9SS type A sorting domain-containing protein [Ignavibacteriaceae bacterium]
MKFIIYFFLTLQVVFAQYTTPNLGVSWTPDSLVANSTGTVTGSFPNYTINALVTVSASDKITVLPGSIINFTSSTAGFETNGVFSAVGTEQNIITFTSSTPDSTGAYMGFRFNDTSIDSLCKIKFTKIEYAYYGLRCVDASPSLENNYLYKCRRGVNLSSSSPLISGNKIERSYEYGITMTLGSSPVIEHNELVNNNTQNTSPKNQISIGTQGINSPTIKYNRIYGGWNNRTGGISISALLGGSGSTSEIAFNEIFNNSFGITLGGGTISCYVHHNRIYNNKINPDPMTTGSGINVNGNSANTPVIAHNEIYGNWWGITIQNGTTIQAGPQPNIGNLNNASTDDDGFNMIYNNVQGTNIYDLYNNCSNDIYAQNNDWRVYDSISVDGHIMHKTDDPLRGSVFFMPFSQFIPIELQSFNVSSDGDNILISWSTVSEKNNSHFSIEKRTKYDSEWGLVGNVYGSGTTQEVHNYSFSDTPENPGILIYRLVQHDYNGESRIVAEKEINFISPQFFELFQNYPNPFNPVTSISYRLGKDCLVKLTVFDALGNQVTELVNENQSSGVYTINFNGASLASGIYFYKLATDEFTSIKKLILLK